MLELVKLIKASTIFNYSFYRNDNFDLVAKCRRWIYEIRHLLKPTDPDTISNLFSYYENASLTYKLSHLVTHLREVLKKIYT